MGAIDDLLKKQDILLKNIKTDMPLLESLLNEINSDSIYENSVYRYYHHSFKAYHFQPYTAKIYQALKKISPHKPKAVSDNQFNTLIKKGTGKEWKLSDNKQWEKICEPITSAFLHSKYFLEMAVKYGKKYDSLPKPGTGIPFGWAALLELYNIR